MCSTIYRYINTKILRYHNSMAVTTAFVNFSRTLGGVFGLAIAGTLFNNTLKTGLQTLGLSSQTVEQAANDVKFVQSLTGTEHDEIVQQYVNALNLCFIVMIPYGGLSFLCSLGIKHFALRKSIGDAKPPEEKQNSTAQTTEQTTSATPTQANSTNEDLEKGTIEIQENE
jgi:hypothetical protein